MGEGVKQPDVGTNTFCGVKWSQKRIVALAFIIIAVIVLIIISITIPILSIHGRRQDSWRQQISALSSNNYGWVGECRDAITHGITATRTLEGMVIGQLTSIPRWNASISDRLKGQSFSSFPVIANNTMTHFRDNVVYLFTAPGGVVCQTSSAADRVSISPLVGMDLFAHKGLLHRVEPTPRQVMFSSIIGVIGPSIADADVVTAIESLGQQLNNSAREFFVQVQHPIYNTTNIAQYSIDNFWGFANALIDVQVLATNNQYTEYLEQRKIDYVMFVAAKITEESEQESPGHSPDILWRPPTSTTAEINITFTNTTQRVAFTAEEIEVISTSLPHNATSAEMQKLLDSSTLYTIYPNGHGWYFAVRDISHPTYLPHNTSVEIVVVALTACFSFALVAVMVVIRCTAEYDGAHNAPRRAPFALLIIGPSQAEELWAIAADHMITCVEQINTMLVKMVEEHRSYLLPTQLIPNSSTFVFSTVESAVCMAFDVIEELQRNPPDERLRELLGEDSQLLLSYAIHWCTDATVTEDKVEDALLYAGPDVAYAGRMWVFSSPNTVTLSEAAARMALASSYSESWVIAPLCSMFLHGVDGRQELFTVLDPRAELLCTAHDAAARGLARWQARLRRASRSLSIASDVVLHLPIGLQCRHGSELDGILRNAGDEDPIIGTEEADGEDGYLQSLFLSRVAPVLSFSDSPVTVMDFASPARVDTLRSNPLVISQQGVSIEGEQRWCSRRSSTTSSSSAKSSSEEHTCDDGEIVRLSSCGRRRVEGNPLQGRVVWQPIASTPLSSLGDPWLSSPSPSRRRGQLDIVRSSSDLMAAQQSLMGLAKAPLTAPADVDDVLRAAFERQALTLPTSYDSVRALVFYFYISYDILFKPLTAQERSNLQQRLATAFGVPPRDCLPHLAACCVVRHLQQQHSLMWIHTT